MRYTRLGRTNLRVSVIGFGGIPDLLRERLREIQTTLRAARWQV